MKPKMLCYLTRGTFISKVFNPHHVPIKYSHTVKSLAVILKKKYLPS